MQKILGESNEWYILRSFEGSFTERYITAGDTLIEDEIYKILSMPGSVPDLFLREDTNERRVYAIIPGLVDSSEIVYIDFSLQEGDSILLTRLDYWQHYWYWVDSIRYELTSDGPRKTMYLKGAKDEYGHYQYPTWMEGIGALCDPILREFSSDE